MNAQGSVARAGSSARALRASKGSGQDLAVENARLRREVARLQALCDQQATKLLRQTETTRQLRGGREASVTNAQRELVAASLIADPAQTVRLEGVRY